MKPNFVWLLAFVVLVATVNADLPVRGIIATGKGILPRGDNLVLTYNTGREDWIVCYWYRFKTVEKYETCIFLAQGNGTASIKQCKPNDDRTLMTYSGTVKSECTITIKNVTDDDDRTWAVRVDDQMHNREKNVTVAVPFDKVVLEAGPLVAGQPGMVNCSVIGGRPAPMINYQFDRQLDNNSTMKQEVNDQNLFNSWMHISIVPKVEDHGVQMNCSAVLLDGNDKPLFGIGHAKPVILNVTFPPQPISSKTAISISGNTGDNLTLSIQVKANPTPTVYKWFKLLMPDKHTNSSSNSTKPSEERLFDNFIEEEINSKSYPNKYTILALTRIDNSLTYEAKLNINSLEVKDHSIHYKLYLENSVGKQSYYFEVEVNDHNTSDQQQPSKSKTSSIIIVVIVLFIIALAIICVFLYKKFFFTGNETTPQ